MAVWVCLKKGSENMVLVVLLQIGAKDLIVFSTHPPDKLQDFSVSGLRAD